MASIYGSRCISTIDLYHVERGAAYLLQRNILAIERLHQVFLTIDDADGASCIDPANVASLEPPIFGESHGGLELVVVVVVRGTMASEPDLSFWWRTGRQIPSSWLIDKLHLSAIWHRSQ